MHTNPHAHLIQALTDGNLYAHATATIEILETHISWVVLTGIYAYKIKKPVDLGFVDFSTLAKRQFFCQEELRLNRRLAPTLYLEVVPIYGTPSQPCFHAQGSPIEYAVKMVQFAQDRLLGHLLATGTLQAGHIDQLVHEVSAFHARIDTADPTSRFGTPEMVYEPVQENFLHLFDAIDDPLRHAQANAIEAWCRHVFTTHRADFVLRQQAGCIRECHGDMHAGNMVLVDDEVVIFDCIEFNESLRWIDVASDVAFLVMDLEDRGRPDFAHRFLDGYMEATGDYDLLKLLPFYLVYRALVRAKVAGIRLGQSGLPAAEAAHIREEFGSYIDLADRYTRPPRPRFFITHGVSGSGKTRHTQYLLEAIGVIRLRSDVERKRLFGLAPLEHSAGRGDIDLYTPEATRRTYAQLAHQAARIVQAGFSVIVDATFARRAQREMFRQLAAQLNVPCTILAFHAREETLRQRVARRRAQADDASEADLAVLAAQLTSLEPLTSTEQAVSLSIDTDVPQAAQRLLHAVRTIPETQAGWRGPCASP